MVVDSPCSTLKITRWSPTRSRLYFLPVRVITQLASDEGSPAYCSILAILLNRPYQIQDSSAQDAHRDGSMVLAYAAQGYDAGSSRLPNGHGRDPAARPRPRTGSRCSSGPCARGDHVSRCARPIPGSGCAGEITGRDPPTRRQRVKPPRICQGTAPYVRGCAQGFDSGPPPPV